MSRKTFLSSVLSVVHVLYKMLDGSWFTLWQIAKSQLSNSTNLRQCFRFGFVPSVYLQSSIGPDRRQRSTLHHFARSKEFSCFELILLWKWKWKRITKNINEYEKSDELKWKPKQCRLLNKMKTMNSDEIGAWGSNKCSFSRNWATIIKNIVWNFEDEKSLHLGFIFTSKTVFMVQRTASISKNM